jgi:hypothetical protein
MYLLECERLHVPVSRTLAFQLPMLDTDMSLLALLPESGRAVNNETSPAQVRQQQVTNVASPTRLTGQVLPSDIVANEAVPRLAVQQPRRPAKQFETGSTQWRLSHFFLPENEAAAARSPPERFGGRKPHPPAAADFILQHQRPISSISASSASSSNPSSRPSTREQHQHQNQGVRGAGSRSSTKAEVALVRRLDCSRNLLGPQGFRAVLPVLEQIAHSVRHIDLTLNRLDDGSAAALCRLAGDPAATPRLEQLDLRQNDISQRGARLLQVVAARRSPSLRILVSGNADINPALVRMIEAPQQHRPTRFLHRVQGGDEAVAWRRVQLAQLRDAADELSDEEDRERDTVELAEQSDRRELTDKIAAQRQEQQLRETRRKAAEEESGTNDGGGTFIRQRSASVVVPINRVAAHLASLEDEQQRLVLVTLRRRESIAFFAKKDEEEQQQRSRRRSSHRQGDDEQRVAAASGGAVLFDLSGAFGPMELSMSMQNAADGKRRKKKRKTAEQEEEHQQQPDGDAIEPTAAAAMTPLSPSALQPNASIRLLERSPSRFQLAPLTAAAVGFDAAASKSRIHLLPMIGEDGNNSSTSGGGDDTPSGGQRSGRKKKRKTRRRTDDDAQQQQQQDGCGGSDAEEEEDAAIDSARSSVARDCVAEVIGGLLHQLTPPRSNGTRPQQQSPEVEAAAAAVRRDGGTVRQLAAEIVRGAIDAALQRSNSISTCVPQHRGGLTMVELARPSSQQNRSFSEKFPALSLLKDL